VCHKTAFVAFGSAALALCGVLVGCADDPRITQYTIPKPEQIQLPVEKPQPATESRPERMLGAIVPAGMQTWFFKLSGPVDPVASRLDQFRAFLASLRISKAGTPEWTLPEGWSRQPGSGMRFATLVIGDDPPLELSVTALPRLEGDDAEQLLANINRWRGQLGLPPTTADKLVAESETIPIQDGTAATLVNLVGTTQSGGMMTPPFARGGLSNRPSVEKSAPPQLVFAAPEGWSPGKSGGMRKAAFEVVEGDRRVEITVIDLPREGPGGDRLANVNRWRDQIKLPPLAAAELPAALRKIDVGSLTGDAVELIGEQQSILGVMVDYGDKTWYVKLQGPTDLAVAQKANLEAFVKSLRFE